MADKFSWSTSVGRWFGIPVSMHLFLLLFLVSIFSVEWQFVAQYPGSKIAGTGIVTSLVLIASLLLHELAHMFAIRNLGGEVRSIVLMPWGGASDFEYPQANGSRSVVHVAGMLANGALFLLGAVLLMQTGSQSLASMINPFDPHGFDTNDWERSLVTIVTWVNFQLLIVNMIPCFPFDGTHLFRCLFRWINPELSRIKVETTIMAIGHLIAVALIGVAWLLPYESYTSVIQAPWAILVIAGIALIFASRYSCHVEILNSLPSDWDDEMNEIDEFDSIYGETDSPVDFTDDEQYSQWLNEKRAEREKLEQELIEEEERRSDAILEKLHSQGIDSLTEDDKSLLSRVSARIRKRRQGVDS